MSLATVLLLSLIVASSEGFSDQGSESTSHQNGLRRYKHITEQFTAEGTCTDLWFTPRNGTCHCGDSIHDVVSCDEQTKEVKVLDCFCMTNDLATNQTVIGACLFNCVNWTRDAQYEDMLYHPAPSTCAYMQREGTLCGECDYSNGSFPYAYSYDMDCIQCTTPHSWWLYIAVAFLPLTAFIALILIFRISAASPELRAFVCFAQALVTPIHMRIMFLQSKHISPLLGAIINTYATLYGIWNLDFFRTVLPGICLHLTTLQVLALDYLIGVYPMLLMVIAYILVELHGHGFKPVLLIWKPFHHLFVRVRREWKIQTSIVDAFVTFFILSTTKFFSVSFDLLIPTKLFIANGSSIGLRLFYNPNIEYMKHNHLIYALLALTILCLFTLPLSVLIFSSFQRVRNFFRNHRIQIRVVQEFLHVFQQYYKEECRWFAGYYFLTLFGNYLLYTFTLTGYVYTISIIYCIISAIIVLVVEPYKEEYAIYNIQDCVLFLWQALFSASVCFMNFAGMFQTTYLLGGQLSVIIVTTVPIIFIATVFTRRMWKRSGWKLCKRSQTDSDLDESLAHRITDSSQYKDTCGYVPMKKTSRITKLST